MFDHLPQFMSAPTLCQFAKNGQWESAWSFPRSPLPSHSQLAAYLAQSTELAFEAFFGDSFFGARLTGSALEVENFGVKCLRAVHAQELFFQVFRHDFCCPVPGQQPAYAEIGCVNAWRSVGALRASMPELAPDRFENLLHTVFESSISRDTHNSKAIEFAFERPLAHWFGLPISGSDESSQISGCLLRQAIALVQPLPSQKVTVL